MKQFNSTHLSILLIYALIIISAYLFPAWFNWCDRVIVEARYERIKIIKKIELEKARLRRLKAKYDVESAQLEKITEAIEKKA